MTTPDWVIPLAVVERAMRDVAPATEVAKALAELEGWK